MTNKTRIKNALQAIAPKNDETQINVTLGDGSELVTVNVNGRPEVMTFREAARRFPRDYIFVTYDTEQYSPDQ